MWKTKVFRTKRDMDRWIRVNDNRYQWEEIFVDNAYGVEYRPLRKASETSRVAATDWTPKYKQHVNNLKKLIRELDKALADHQKKQSQEASNYGYVGDVAHVSEEMKELVRFLSGRDTY